MEKKALYKKYVVIFGSVKASSISSTKKKKKIIYKIKVSCTGMGELAQWSRVVLVLV